TMLVELGGMIVFLVDSGGAVHTPELTSTILEGVTRSWILQLLAVTGRAVHARSIHFAEVIDQSWSGEIDEAFRFGTTAVVTPIGQFKGTDLDLVIGDGKPGPVTTEMHTKLTDLQYGRTEDTHGWLYRLV